MTVRVKQMNRLVLLGKVLWLTWNRKSEIALQCLIAAYQTLCLNRGCVSLCIRLRQPLPKLVLRKLVSVGTSLVGLCAGMGRPFLDLQDCSVFGKPHCKGENFPWQTRGEVLHNPSNSPLGKLNPCCM